MSLRCGAGIRWPTSRLARNTGVRAAVDYHSSSILATRMTAADRLAEAGVDAVLRYDRPGHRRGH